MPSFSTKRRVPFTAKEMFALVADVERYPEFLPLCEALTLQSRVEKGTTTELSARMSVGYGAIRESFSTRVLLNEPQKIIDVFYLDGPFRYLENRWRFVDVEGGCDIDFFITYEFSSRALGLLVGALFDKAFRRFAQAFEDRAHLVYRRAPLTQLRPSPLPNG